MIWKNFKHRCKLAWANWLLMWRFDVLIEQGVTIKNTSTISFGCKCTVQSGAYVYGSRLGHRVRFGDYTVLAHGVTVLGDGGFDLGDYSHLGPMVVITTQYGDSQSPMETEKPRVKYSAVTIGRGCWIGSGSVVMPGAMLGNQCVVAPNSVVYGHWPDGAKLSGNPARAISNHTTTDAKSAAGVAA